jgi:hypothetical protein
MNATTKQLAFTVEIELPAYVHRNRLRRDFVVAQTLRAADRIAPGHFVERLGIGGDEIHLIRVADEMTAMRLRLANQRILRASYRDDLDLDYPAI